MDSNLFGMEAGSDQPHGDAGRERSREAPPRLRRADRKQVCMIACSLDELLPEDHVARTVWQLVEALDVSAFEDVIEARGSEPGRAATDPRILIALWLYATLEGEGSGRKVDRHCQYHDAYRWIRGGVSLNQHTISDFRVAHEAAVDNLLTQLIVLLLKAGAIDLEQVSQDGLRVRASAGASSFRAEESLVDLEAKARRYVESLKQQNDPAVSAKQQAKREADAADRAARLARALHEELPKLQEIKANTGNRKKKASEPRVSTTDPEARVMKMADGGYRPAYNIQLAVDVNSRAVVGVEVTNEGRDTAQSAPMREQIEQRLGKKPEAQLFDGGYASLEAIDQAEAEGVTVYAPVKNKSRNTNNEQRNEKDSDENNKKGDATDVAKKSNGQNKAERRSKSKSKSKSKSNATDPYARKRDDTEHTYNWRQRMANDEAKAIYKNRASTVETVNGDLTEHRGLRRLPVRGSPKVKCVVLWCVLAYTIKLFAPLLIAALESAA